eukprot:3958548-Amphidinium_carterae.1
MGVGGSLITTPPSEFARGRLMGKGFSFKPAHTDVSAAAIHGVTERDRLGKAKADEAAQQTLGAVDRRQALWRRFSHYASAFRNFIGAIGPSLSERQEKL